MLSFSNWSLVKIYKSNLPNIFYHSFNYFLDIQNLFPYFVRSPSSFRFFLLSAVCLSLFSFWSTNNLLRFFQTSSNLIAAHGQNLVMSILHVTLFCMRMTPCESNVSDKKTIRTIKLLQGHTNGIPSEIFC